MRWDSVLDSDLNCLHPVQLLLLRNLDQPFLLFVYLVRYVQSCYFSFECCNKVHICSESTLLIFKFLVFLAFNNGATKTSSAERLNRCLHSTPWIKSSSNAVLIALITNIITRLLSYYNVIYLIFIAGKEAFYILDLRCSLRILLFMSVYDPLSILDAVFLIWCRIYLEGLKLCR